MPPLAKRKTIPFRAVYLLLPPVAGLGFVLMRPDLADPIGRFGPMLTGYSALVAAVFAAVKGAQEWADWQRRKRDDKMSEVAGRAIITATKFADSMHGLASFYVWESDPEQEEAESYSRHQLRKFDSRLEKYGSDIRDYQEACLLAEAYLPDPALQRVRALWDLFIEIRMGWRKFGTFAGKDSPDGRLAEEGHQQVMNAENKLDAALEALRSELRRHTVGGTDSTTL